MEKSNTKFVLSILLGIVVLVVLFFVIKNNKNKIPNINPDTNNQTQNIDKDDANVIEDEKSIAFCFANYGPTNNIGYSDKYTLSMLITGDKVKGNLKLIPAEKDSKVGTFSGTVTPVDPIMMARTANLIWTATGEGVTNKEELSIIFGEGTASIGMGEMALGTNGTYVYKDKTKLNYDLQLTDIACEKLDNK